MVGILGLIDIKKAMRFVHLLLQHDDCDQTYFAYADGNKTDGEEGDENCGCVAKVRTVVIAPIGNL